MMIHGLVLVMIVIGATMSNNYQDSFGQYHTDVVTDFDPIPTNDGFIHTAYAQKAGLQVHPLKLKELFNQCLKNGKLFQRLPNKPLPPPSRDVVLGATALGLLKPEHINGWNFSPYEVPKFNLFSFLMQLKQLAPTFKPVTEKDSKSFGLYFRHRNYFWKNNLDQLYRFSFSVPLQDRHFTLKKWDKFQWYNPIHLFYAAYGKLQSKFSPNAIDWLKYGEKRGLEGIKREFPEDHPIRKKLGL